jgi:choline dehydrogenase-like flavoprotein
MKTVLEDAADFVVIGSGAGGATAARVLSAAGYSVIVLEEGPELHPGQRSNALLPAMAESMRDMATIATSGSTPMPLLMGRCVGGSTAVNSGIIWRMPEDVQVELSERHGLGDLLDPAALDRCFSAIESDLGVAPVREEVLGGNAQRLREGALALGLTGSTIRRNAARCQGSSRCLQGCPNGARQSMDVSYIPDAVRRGARVHALTRAQRVLISAGHAHGVVAQRLDASSLQPVGVAHIHARRAVICAAGAIYTPLLLWRSGLRGRVGHGFQAHPGAAVVGRFPDPVSMGFGATQAYEVPLRARGFKLESLALPPELLAARLPGTGSAWQEQLANLDHFGQFCAVHRAEAVGRVRPTWFGGFAVRYNLTPRDVERMKQSIALLVRIMFAAGADEVYPGVASVPERLTSEAQAQLIEAARVSRRDFHLLASHHFGTAAAGSDPKRSVVAPTLQTHAVRGLYVMDASALPTNLGVNPQHTIMAVVRRAAEWLADSKREVSSAA